MSVSGKWYGGVIVGVLIAIALLCGVVLAQRQIEVTAVVESTDGFVDVKLIGSDEWNALSEGMELVAGDEIETGPEGQVILKLEDGSKLKVGTNSRVLIKELGMVEVTNVHTSSFELVRGKIRAVVTPFINKESSFTIETENASIGVRGTDFGASFDPDTLKTYIISFEDCVSVVATTFPGIDPIAVCANESLTVFSSQDPGMPLGVDAQKLEEFLKGMEMEGKKKPGGTSGEVLPPEVTRAFIDNNINTVIDLEDVDEFVTITRDNLTTQNKINLTGEATDDTYPITSVEYSIDGGVVWTEGVIWEVDGAVAQWQFEFLPGKEGEFELQIRATNSKGAVSNPSFFGPWTIKYWDATYEEIAQAFIDAFIAALESGDLTGIEDIVSDMYDGSLGGYYSKDELLEALIHFFGTGENIDITAVIESISQGSIIATTSWNGSVGGQNLRGSTTWWLSEDVDFMLAHAEGDWFIDLQEGITLELSEGSGACGDVVKVLLTVPDVPLNIETVYVEVETDCSRYEIPLDRTYFFNERGVNTGFGGTFPVERTRCSLTPACTNPNLVQYDENGSYADVSYDDYDYMISDSISLPEDEISLELNLNAGGAPCNNTVEIFVTEPSLRKGYATVDVELSTGSCDYIGAFTLDTAYYDARRTPGMGYGGVITVEEGGCAGTTCTPPVIGYNSADNEMEVAFVDPLNSETLDEWIDLPATVVPATVWFHERDHGPGVCKELEVFMRAPSVDPGISSVDVELGSSSGGSDTYTLTRSHFDSQSGYPPGEGFGERIPLENNTGDYGPGCCSGITYHNGENVFFLYDGSSDGNAYYVTATATGLSAIGSPSMTLTQINPGLPSPCDVGVMIMYTIPSYMSCNSMSDYTVALENPCGDYGSVILTRSYFETHGGAYMMGFGGEIVVEAKPTCPDAPTCSPDFTYNQDGSKNIIVRDSAFGVVESITLP